MEKLTEKTMKHINNSEYKFTRMDVMKNPNNNMLEPVFYFYPNQEFINIARFNNNRLWITISSCGKYTTYIPVLAIVDEVNIGCQPNFSFAPREYLLILRDVPFQGYVKNIKGTFRIYSKRIIYPNNISKNNSFNNYGNKHIRHLLGDKKWTKYVDKLQFKELCKNLGIKTFKTLAIFNNPSDIKKIYQNLPNSFVIKSNKGSGRNIFVKDKKDHTVDNLIKKMKKFNDKYNDEEPQYELYTSKIYIEEYIEPVPSDIKVILYNKKPTILWVDNNRFENHERVVYNIKDYTIERLDDCMWCFPNSNSDPDIIKEIKQKNKVKDTIDFSQRFNLSIPLVRIDFYFYKDEFYAGEVTFSSGNLQEKISESCAKLSLQ